MYKNILISILFVSFLCVSKSYAQNLLLDRTHTLGAEVTTQNFPISPTTDEYRLLPVKAGDGGAITHAERPSSIELSYIPATGTIVDNLTIDIINPLTNELGNGDIAVVDASTNSFGDVVLLLSAQNANDFERQVVVRRGGNNIPGVNVINLVRGIRYVVLYVPFTGNGFGDPSVFNTITNVWTFTQLRQFIPRFIQANNQFSIQIAGLIDNFIGGGDFLNSPITPNSSRVENSRDIFVGRYTVAGVGAGELSITHRLGTNQAPPTGGGGTSTSNIAVNNELLGFDLGLDGDGVPYLYMSHNIRTFSGFIPAPILTEWITGNGNPPQINTFTLGSTGEGTRTFSVYQGNRWLLGDASQLVWGTHSLTELPPNLILPAVPNIISPDVQRNYRNYLVVQDDRASILGAYDGQTGENIIFSDGELDISQTTANTNTFVSSWNFNEFPVERWTRLITSDPRAHALSSFRKRPISIDTDFDGNLYFAYDNSNAGSTILPLPASGMGIGTSIMNAKMTPCGDAFWNIVSTSENLNNDLIAHASFGFSRANQIYTAHPEGIQRVANEPIELCQGETLTANNINDLSTTVNATWQNNCGDIATTSAFTPIINGNYSAFGNAADEEFSNALWLRVMDVPDFTFIGETEVCPIDFEQEYSLNSGTGAVPNYEWLVDGVQIFPTDPAVPHVVHINWSSFSLGAHTITVNATLNNCTITRSLVVNVVNSNPTIIVSDDADYCQGGTITTYPLVPPNAIVAGVMYEWTVFEGGTQVANPLNFITTLVGGQAQAIVDNITPGSTIEYRLLARYPSGCEATNSVSVTKNEALNVVLNIPESVCKSQNTLTLVGTLDGNPVSGVYTINTLQTGVITGNILDLSLLSPDDYEITFSYSTGGCSGEVTKVLSVGAERKYTVEALGCLFDPVYNPNEDARVSLNRYLSAHDRIRIVINPGTPTEQVYNYTNGSSWNFTNIPLGTPMEISILTDTPLNITASCGVGLNGNVSTTGIVSANIVVEEAPKFDLYLKDSPADFGLQPSVGGWSSQSIFFSTTAPVAPTNTVVDVYNIHNSYVNDNVFGFYYQDDASFSAAVSNLGGRDLVVGNTNYMSIVVYNGGCFPYGKGVAVDAYFKGSNFGSSGSNWNPLILNIANDDNVAITGGLIRIPKDIEPGERLIIVAEVLSNQIPANTGHTCSIARILDCHSSSDIEITDSYGNVITTLPPYPDDHCIAETPSQALPSTSIYVPINQNYIRDHNNATWKNIDFITETQNESEITIYNGDAQDRIARVKFDFDDHNIAHYLEYNNFQISLPTSLAFRWQQGGRVNNNLQTIQGSDRILEFVEHRNAWFEVLLHPGESYTMGLSFDINQSTVPNSQDPVYYLSTSQYNDGELAGGVGYELLIDFVDAPPANPSELNAQVLSSSKIRLNWVDNSDNELVFVLERREVGTPSYVHVANINAGTTTYTDENLSPYTFYEYRLRAISNTGLSSDHTYSTQVRTLDAAPLAPSNLVATLRSDCKVDLTWEDNAINESRYEIVRVESTTSTILHSNLSADTENYVDNTLSVVGNSYTYQVIVYSASGVYSAVSEVDLVIAPVSVSPLIGDAISATQINLTWTAVSGATGYKLEKKVNNAWTILGNFTPSMLSFVDNTVSASTTYEYRLSVVEGCISSAFSEVAVSTPAPPPVMKKISGYFQSQIFASASANEVGDIGNVLVELVDENDVVIAYMFTGSDGYYEFEVAVGTPFTIRPSKDINKMNGVDQNDATSELWTKYLQAYQKGINIYTISPYDAIVADMDGDCDVDYDDYNLLQSAVYSTNTFPVSSWQFVPSNYELSASTVFACPYAQEREYVDGIIADKVGQDFIGIKVGDLIQNADPLMKVGSSTKAEDSPYTLALEVVPNPFVTSTQLLFGSPTETLARVSVYNSLGVEVYNEEVEVQEGRNTHTLQLNIASGLYYVHVIGENINYTSKIVIEK